MQRRQERRAVTSKVGVDDVVDGAEDVGEAMIQSENPKSKSKGQSKSKAKAGNEENQSVLGGIQSTGREAPCTVLTVVELRCEGERLLGPPRGAARRT